MRGLHIYMLAGGEWGRVGGDGRELEEEDWRILG
jgi:hypothetical protein